MLMVSKSREQREMRVSYLSVLPYPTAHRCRNQRMKGPVGQPSVRLEDHDRAVQR